MTDTRNRASREAAKKVPSRGEDRLYGAKSKIKDICEKLRKTNWAGDERAEAVMTGAVAAVKAQSAEVTTDTPRANSQMRDLVKEAGHLVEAAKWLHLADKETKKLAGSESAGDLVAAKGEVLRLIEEKEWNGLLVAAVAQLKGEVTKAEALVASSA